MGNPIQNLGDYNIVREALQAVGGNKQILYKSIGDTAVAKAAPKIFRKGGLIGSANAVIKTVFQDQISMSPKTILETAIIRRRNFCNG